MSHSAGRATWGVLAFIAIASTIISLNPVRQVTGAENTYVNCGDLNNTGKACDDYIGCTVNDLCVNNSGIGSCEGTPNDTLCNPPYQGNECTVGTCVPQDMALVYGVNGGTGCVLNTTEKNGDSCLGNPCVMGETCFDGECDDTGERVNCSPMDTQCAEFACDPSGEEGNCANVTAINNGTACDDLGAVKCVTESATCINGNCTSPPDSDGDSICDASDSFPNEFDPTGYCYDDVTGHIIPGCKVEVACGPADEWNLNQPLDGSTGQYQFTVTNLTSEISCTLTITAPRGCRLSETCLPQASPLDPTGQNHPNGAEYVVGNYPDPQNPSHLSSAECTPWYTQIELEQDDPQVINNNIPFHCPDVKAPTVSHWGLGAMALLLMGAAAFGLLRRHSRQT